jgi:hypothetical protein
VSAAIGAVAPPGRPALSPSIVSNMLAILPGGVLHALLVWHFHARLPGMSPIG